MIPLLAALSISAALVLNQAGASTFDSCIRGQLNALEGAEIEDWVSTSLSNYDFDFRQEWGSKSKAPIDPQVGAAIAELNATGYGGIQLFKGATVDRLKQIAYDPAYAQSVFGAIERNYFKHHGGGSGNSVTRLREDAKVILARRALPRLKPGMLLTEEQFKTQARIAQIPIQNFNIAFRYEMRSPMEVVSAHGFTPNPNKPAATLIENSQSHFGGGGNFVSATHDGFNHHIIRGESFERIKEDVASAASDISKAKRQGVFFKQYENDREAVPLELAKSTVEQARATRVEKIYEYEIQNVPGVETQDFGTAAEKEIVTRQIPSDHVKRYREIRVVKFEGKATYETASGGVHTHKIDFEAVITGDWKKMP